MPTQSSQARFQAKLVEENQHGKLKPSMVVLHKMIPFQLAQELLVNYPEAHAEVELDTMASINKDVENA